MNPVVLFWSLVVALVVATLCALVWPLVRMRAREEAPDEDEATTAVLRDQRRQLDADHAAGLVSDQEREHTRSELVTRLGEELEQAPPAQATPPSRLPWLAALILVALLPAGAVATYFLLGTPEAVRVAEQDRAAHSVTQEQMVGLVEKLAARMRANPDDPSGWLLLGRSYTALGNFRESAQAYAEAARRMPEDAQVYADWADSLAMAQGRTLEGQPTQLIERALAIDPRNKKALALDATAKLERGDNTGALARWRELRTLVAPGTEEAQRVDAVIAEVESRQTGGIAAPARPTLDKGKPPAATASTAAAGAGTGTGTVSGKVELAPALKDKVAAGDTLFILARAVNGPRMPLAVLRVSASELPRAFTLDDAMAMSPAAKLSSAGDVIVEARVSKSGNAAPQAGDLRGASGVVKPGTANIHIVIGEVVP